MKKYVCQMCGYVYDPQVGDPDGGIQPGTAFEDIPDDWVCPLCGASKSDFAAQDLEICVLMFQGLVGNGRPFSFAFPGMRPILES